MSNENGVTKTPGDLAKETRERLGLTPLELAKQANVPILHVEALENGTMHMLSGSALQIWKALHINWQA